MTIFSNILFAALISCFIGVIARDPTAYLQLFQRICVDIWFTFSVNQWRVVAVFGLVQMLQVLYTRYLLSQYTSRGLRYDGRRYVAQGLKPTAEETAVATKTDESNQTSVNGKSVEKQLVQQKQAAPNMNEDIALPKATTEEPYATTMYLGQFPFSATTNPLGSTVFDIDWTMLSGNSNITRLFMNKRFAKFDIRFTVNVTGNPMATGIIAVAALPDPCVLPGSIASQDPTTNVAWSNRYDRILSSNHVLCDMSIDGVYKIDVPYTLQTKYMRYNTYDNVNITPPWFQLMGVCISPYLPATGQTSSINLEIYANLINLETMDTAPYKTQSLLSFGETTNIVTQLDHCNDASLPINVSGDSLSATVPGAAMLDNPPDTRNAETSVFRMAYQKVTNFWNKVDVYKTSHTAKEVALFDKPLNSELRLGVDEMSIDFFRGRWFSPSNTNAVYPITTSSATGALLAQFPIIPVPTAGPFGSNFTPNTGCDFTQWICSFFRFWRGSMKFRIVIASNGFKRGKILVCVNYGGNIGDLPSNIASGQLDPRSLPHMIIDLSNKDRFIDIDVPYKCMHEYLRMPNITNNGTLSNNESSLGQLAIYVVSPLQVSNGTATTVNLNVFQAWGKDFEVFSPQNIPGTGFCAQADLKMPPGTTNTTLSSLMIPTTSMQQLLRTMPSLVGTYQFTATGTAANVAPAVIPIHPVFQSTCPLWSGVMAAYSGCRGGYRLMIRFMNIQLSSSFRVSYYESLYPQDGSGLAFGTLPTSLFETTNLGLDTTTASAVQTISDIPTMSRPLALTMPDYINGITTGAGQVRTYGQPPISEFIVDPYTQPEVIIEVPDPSPNYRSQQTVPMPVGYTLGGTDDYNPYYDRNIGFLVIQPLDCNPVAGTPDVGTLLASCKVTMTAADDFRAFWYNGGPTSIQPYCVGVSNSSGAFSYFNPAGR